MPSLTIVVVNIRHISDDEHYAVTLNSIRYSYKTDLRESTLLVKKESIGKGIENRCPTQKKESLLQGF